MADEFTFEERKFAEQVRLLREENGWSQAELASRMQARGISYANQSTVSRIENLARPVRMIEAQVLARIFDRSVAMMMEPDGELIMIKVLGQATERMARNAYVALKKAAREAVQTQEEAVQALDNLNSMFGDGSQLEPDTRDRFHHIVMNLEGIARVDLLGETTAILGGGEGSRSWRMTVEMPGIVRDRMRDPEGDDDGEHLFGDGDFGVVARDDDG